jgi:Uma2 family endonuclease
MVMPHAVERWTREMVLALPDDGMRHELIDGIHIVSPTPRFVHQRVVQVLGEQIGAYLKPLRVAEVMILPGDLALGEDEVLQPDLFVYPLTSPPPKNWDDITALLLVVEVLSPSTARYDRGLKRRRYQRARTPEYWVVDIDARLVERWRPDDTRPEVDDSELEWRVVPEASALVLDLPSIWREALGED